MLESYLKFFDPDTLKFLELFLEFKIFEIPIFILGIAIDYFF